MTTKRQISIILAVLMFLSLLPSAGWASDSSIMTCESDKIATQGPIMAVKDDGTLWQWGGLGLSSYGKSVPTQIMGVTNVKAVDVSSLTRVLLKEDGTVWVWGNNSYGQMGDSTYSAHPNSGFQAFDTDIPVPTQVKGLTGVVNIGSGDYHIIVLKADGTVWGWGLNEQGQLGDGTFTNRYTPVQVKGLSGVKAISTRDDYTIAVKNDGTVWAWGDCVDGGNCTLNISEQRVVDIYSTPVQIKGLTDIVAVSAGNKHKVALKSDGTVWIWGDYVRDLLGDGSDYFTDDSNTLTPSKAKIDDVVAIAAASEATLALKKDGTVWAWGSNLGGISSTDINGFVFNTGHLGTGSSETRIDTPTQVQALSDVVAIAADDTFFAIKEDGSVWAWGSNSYGEYGNNQSQVSDIPVLSLINLKAQTNGF